jgi:hypothetical protein
MGFPIYYCGQILFRDGRPAFSKDCCCGYFIPCCGNVYWPVDPNRKETHFNLGIGGGQLGGPSQIINFQLLVTDIITGSTTTYTQVGLSVHAILGTDVSPDDCGIVVERLSSRCFWVVTTNFVAYNALTDETTTGTTNFIFTWRSELGWSVSPMAVPLPGETYGGGDINGNTFSFEQEVPPGSNRARTEGSFTAIGGKYWPPGFVCNNLGLLTYRGRLATDSDLPRGFL